MKFTAHIHKNLMTASQQSGIIKRALYWVPTNAKPLAYKTLLPLSKVWIIGLESKQQEKYFRQRTTPRLTCAIRSWDQVE